MPFLKLASYPSTLYLEQTNENTMHIQRSWFFFYSILTIVAEFIKPSIENKTAQNPNIEDLVNDFISVYWDKGDWDGASSWTGDVMSRLMVSYLSSRDGLGNLSKVDEIFTHITSRSLNAWTLVQYLTQANDDFGWTVALILEILEYTHEYEKRYPHSSVAVRLPVLQNRLAFRAGFLHDVMVESWTPELCDGGAEWQVRTRKRFVWPSVGIRGIYKNTITNHLYNGNNAQIYNAYPHGAFPVNVTEIAVHVLRILWKIVRPLFGWPRSHLQPFNFADKFLLRRAAEGLKWMDQAKLLTNDSLFIDGLRPRFKQLSPEEHSAVSCDIRSESIFTYNQVAGLRALKFLFRATGKNKLLRDGHQAIQNLIYATNSGRMGWNGILEETCDWYGNCSQDMQAFKGVVFLEIQGYCGDLSSKTTHKLQAWHENHCRQYTPWIRTNAAAARSTMDDQGQFGGYWGRNHSSSSEQARGRTVETQLSGLAAQLTLSFFKRTITIRTRSAEAKVHDQSSPTFVLVWSRSLILRSQRYD
jgi:hypothetical protein